MVTASPLNGRPPQRAGRGGSGEERQGTNCDRQRAACCLEPRRPGGTPLVGCRVIDRYHLVLAVWSASLGLGCAVLDRFGPTRVQRHVLALAGVAGVLLGGWGSTRVWPWVVAATLVVAWPDRPSRPHPLGRHAVGCTVVSLLGVWSAVPDTEPALAAGLVLAPVALVRSARGPSVGPGGTAALVVAVLGAVWVGSAGWGAALATAAAVGVVAVGPLVLGFARTARREVAAGAGPCARRRCAGLATGRDAPVRSGRGGGRCGGARRAGPGVRDSATSGAGVELSEPVDRRGEPVAQRDRFDVGEQLEQPVVRRLGVRDVAGRGAVCSTATR